VVFDPLRNELFVASRGSGAVLDDRRLRVAERRDLEGALLCTGFPPRERARAKAQLDCLGALLEQAEDVRRTGSAALDLAYVACGRFDGYFEAGVQPWDIAEARGRQVVAGNVKLVEPLQKTIVSSGYAKAFD
jgi:myo-inositol-1(or 4)-monophosphatase